MENLPQDGIQFIQQHVQNHVKLERKKTFQGQTVKYKFICILQKLKSKHFTSHMTQFAVSYVNQNHMV